MPLLVKQEGNRVDDVDASLVVSTISCPTFRVLNAAVSWSLHKDAWRAKTATIPNALDLKKINELSTIQFY